MAKIQMKTPLVEMDGDEMTRIIWQMVKDKLICPYVDLKTEYYDLGLENREKTHDQVTVDSANAACRLGVAVKCATITPNVARMSEYNLTEMYKSPNGTIRAIMDGTVFRTPIIAKGIEPYIKNWKKPIAIARHAYGDVYKASDALVKAGDTAELVVKAADGTETRYPIHSFKCDGVIQGMHNLDQSIEGFARSCFNFALAEKLDLWFSTKDTISKVYDGRFKAIFAEIYENEYKEKFEAAGIDPAFYANRAFSLDEILPWDIIDCGVTKDFLRRERDRAYAGNTTPNCREHCSGCGANKLGGERTCCPMAKN